MLPFIIPILTFSGGLVVGALSRQPEINRLKEQVRVLQKEVTALRNTMREQQRQIEELKIRYNSINAWSFVKRQRARGMTRGALILQYGLRDYIEMTVAQVRGKKLAGDDLRFFNAFNAMVSDQNLTPEDKEFVKSYIIARHRHDIDNLVPISEQDQNATIQMVEAA